MSTYLYPDTWQRRPWLTSLAWLHVGAGYRIRSHTHHRYGSPGGVHLCSLSLSLSLSSDIFRSCNRSSVAELGDPLDRADSERKKRVVSEAHKREPVEFCTLKNITLDYLFYIFFIYNYLYVFIYCIDCIEFVNWSFRLLIQFWFLRSVKETIKSPVTFTMLSRRVIWRPLT